MKIRVVTLFPEMVSSATSFGVCGRAIRQGLIEFGTTDPRDFTDDAHRTVDDRPYGGGPGMVLKYEPFRAAIGEARTHLPEGGPVVFLSPQGRPFDDSMARSLARKPGMVIVAGRYEGYDERLIQSECDLEISLGDFVLSGGEIAALAVIDAVVRLQPGVLGNEASSERDSFADKLLSFPQFTRPEIADDMPVPSVLKSGNHEQIRRWRLKQALGRTYLRRPDLLATRSLTTEEQQLLQEFLAEQDTGAVDPDPVQH